MASPASASWSRNCRCIWPGAGLPGSASIRRFPITPRFPRTVMAVSWSPICFSSSLNRSWTVAWKPDSSRGENLSVDGSFIQANASRSSRIPREQLTEVAHVKGTVREYLADLEQENPVEEPAHQQDQVSTTDPDSTYSTKGARPAELGYFNNYLIDNRSCVILGVQATAARLSQESAAAREMITRSAERRGCFPQSVAADTTYGNGELLAWFEERDITPYIR